MEGAGKALMPVVSADPDTPLGIRNQRTEGTLLENEWERDIREEGFGFWWR